MFTMTWHWKILEIKCYYQLVGELVSVSCSLNSSRRQTQLRWSASFGVGLGRGEEEIKSVVAVCYELKLLSLEMN